MLKLVFFLAQAKFVHPVAYTVHWMIASTSDGFTSEFRFRYAIGDSQLC